MLYFHRQTKEKGQKQTRLTSFHCLDQQTAPKENHAFKRDKKKKITRKYKNGSIFIQI